MRRTIVMLAVVSMLTVLGAGPAGAVPPVRQTLALTDVIQGFVPECGINMRWDIALTVERSLFFDKDGNLARIQDQVRENNSITNLDTDETLEEGPDSFLQIIVFNDDGTVTISALGLSVHVNQGENAVIDAGRTVLLLGPDGPLLLGLNGRHDVREIDPFTTSDPALLAGFCGAFV